MDHVREWLQAYHDGELTAKQAARVEEHLAVCEACCEELEALAELSTLLQAAPAAQPALSEEQFAAQVALQLPRRVEHVPGAKVVNAGWRLVPLVLVSAWAIGQAVWTLTRGLLTLLTLGLGEEIVATVLPQGITGPGPFGLSGLLELLGLSRLAPSLQGPFGVGEWLVPLALFNVVLPAVFVLLLWSWVGSWWAHRQHQARTANNMDLHVPTAPVHQGN